MRMSALMAQAWLWYLDIVDTGEVGVICNLCGQCAVTYEVGVDTGTRFDWAELDVKIGLHIGQCPERPNLPDQYEQPRIDEAATA